MTLIRKYKVDGQLDDYQVIVTTDLTTIEGVRTNPDFKPFKYPLEIQDVLTFISSYEAKELEKRR